MQRNVSALFHVVVPNSAPCGLSILSAVIAHGAVVALHDVRQVSRSPQKPCGCRHLQSPSSVIGVIAAHLPLCTECCLKSPSLMPSVFSGSGRRTLHTLHLHFLIGAALQVIGVAVCLPRSSHGRHRRHCPCQHCKHQRRYTGVLLPSAPLLCGSISGSRLAVSSVVAVSPLLVSLALLLSVFHLRFHSPGITSGPLSCFTPQSYYLPAERQGQVCTSCSSVFRFVAKRLSPLPHGPQRRHFSGSVKQKNNEPYV